MKIEIFPNAIENWEVRSKFEIPKKNGGCVVFYLYEDSMEAVVFSGNDKIVEISDHWNFNEKNYEIKYESSKNGKFEYEEHLRYYEFRDWLLREREV